MNRETLKQMEQIDRYLSNQLIGEELDSFRLQMDENPEFRKQVELQEAANELIFDYGLLNVREKLEKIHQESSGGPTGASKWWFGILGGLIIGALAIWLMNSPEDQQGSTTDEPEPVTEDVIEIPEETTNSPEEEPVIVEQQEVIVAPKESVPDSERIRKPMVPPALPSRDTNSELSSTIEAPAIKPEKVPCEMVIDQDIIDTEPSCRDRATGKLMILDPDYDYKLDDMTVHSAKGLASLEPGVYTLSVTDPNGCRGKLNFSISAIDCSDLEKTVHVFEPDLGESWSLPDGHGDGQIQIYNRNGRLILEAVVANGLFEWNGRNNAGSLQPSGLYLVHYGGTDGSRRIYEVTLVR